MNTLYLPELREMLAANDLAELQEFCTALHPARTAEFMEGLTPTEAWGVLRAADGHTRVEIFTYLPEEMQIEILEAVEPAELSHLIADMAPDDRVDLIKKVDPTVVEKVLKLVPTKERRDILRLRAYPEGTAGALMTTEVACLTENLTVRQALEEISREGHEFETVYYIYIVDEEMHLRGLVSARQLVTHLNKPQMLLSDLMSRDLVTVIASDEQETVAEKVADYNFLAIPVVDGEQRLVGIITHDDVIDVFQEEATKDAYQAGAVEPLKESYLATPWLQLTRYRVGWLSLLFGGALLTALAMRSYNENVQKFAWIAWFLPLVISTGGNSGSQSATLMIRALTTKEITPGDWRRVIFRELVIGFLLGSCLSLIGYLVGCFMAPSITDALVLPLTIVLVVTCSTIVGSLLPLMFERLGFDPALMSTPFIAGISDIVGIVLYMNVAGWLLDKGI
ncbi:magnesium transporter [Bythopirellula polymerisocia]|uniref:Magnesium transporter MgtE n=1 Tax=Bythopirellula polymerisocia TaxID=2528003 RepID=A0A5C6CFJ7_9BACT|nr:magnesium transporter [Bythopirellula polymerisocia]TWU22805.1 Magnesium transporter MgtE [Bythopirellula polymerisocia]